MSISPEFTESAGRFVSRDVGKAQQHEKSNFSQTCSLLSQYLKENGSFGDLSLGMNRTIEVKSETFRPAPAAVNRDIKSMDLFPQHAGFGASAASTTENVLKKTDTTTIISKINEAKEPETAQMTIFYAGKVHVFDNFPVGKANEVMLLASKAQTFQNHSSGLASTSNHDAPNPVVGAGSLTVSGVLNNLAQEIPQRLPRTIASDLPIARKASLHRFLEKRKDRICARAPYQVNNNSLSSSASIPAKKVSLEENKSYKSWLGLAPQSTKTFEFQL